jgi:hypothetical protein
MKHERLNTRKPISFVRLLRDFIKPDCTSETYLGSHSVMREPRS